MNLLRWLRRPCRRRVEPPPSRWTPLYRGAQVFTRPLERDDIDDPPRRRRGPRWVDRGGARRERG
jgi:hypothetical protein